MHLYLRYHKYNVNDQYNFQVLVLNLIKYPSLTEKSINLYGNRQYTFIVDRSLTKLEIKYAIEKLFQVNVVMLHVIYTNIN